MRGGHINCSLLYGFIIVSYAMIFLNTDVYCSWTKLTERFFKNTPWPEAEAIAPQVGNGKNFK